MELTIYSNNFDDGENVANNGFNGKIFLDNSEGEFVAKSSSIRREFNNIAEAFQYIIENNLPFDSILYCYKDSENQVFKRFMWSNVKFQ